MARKKRSDYDMNPDRSICLTGGHVFDPAKMTRKSRAELLEELSNDEFERLVEAGAIIPDTEAALAAVDDSGDKIAGLRERRRSAAPAEPQKRPKRAKTKKRKQEAPPAAEGEADAPTSDDDEAEDDADGDSGSDEGDSSGQPGQDEPSFGSPEAEAFAAEHGLTSADFVDREVHGADGSILKSDVVDLVEELEGDSDGGAA